MNDSNSIIQNTGTATANTLATALDGLTILMAAAVDKLNREQVDDCISDNTVAVINGLLHLLYCNRDAATACYEQLLAEEQAAERDTYQANDD